MCSVAYMQHLTTCTCTHTHILLLEIRNNVKVTQPKKTNQKCAEGTGSKTQHTSELICVAHVQDCSGNECLPSVRFKLARSLYLQSWRSRCVPYVLQCGIYSPETSSALCYALRHSLPVFHFLYIGLTTELTVHQICLPVFLCITFAYISQI